MSMDSNGYYDRDDYNEVRKYQERRYRARTGTFKYAKRKYTEEENNLIKAHIMSDRELSKKINRSLGAIQRHRAWLKKIAIRQGTYNK